VRPVCNALKVASMRPLSGSWRGFVPKASYRMPGVGSLAVPYTANLVCMITSVRCLVALSDEHKATRRASSSSDTC